jgi:outer membrane protein TolC
MKKSFVLILLFLTGSLYAQVKELTLEESIRIGLSSSKNLIISNSKLNAASAKTDEITSQLLPQLKFSASYTRLSDIPPFEVVMPFLPQPILIQEPILNSYNLRLSLQQPIFTGFRLSSLRSAAKFSEDAVKFEYSAEVNEEAFQIISAFWNYHRAKKVKQSVEENLKSIKAHVEDTKNFLENGLVTINDLLKLEVQHSTLELKLIEAINNESIARTLFNKSVGLPLAQQTDIIPPQINISEEMSNYDQLISEALSNRNELKSIDLRVKASKENLRASRSGWFPSLALYSNYYYARPNQRIMPAKDKFDDTWDVGVSFNWDLWTWGYHSAQAEQSEQLLIQTQTKLDQLKENIEVEVYNNYLLLTASYNKIEVSRKNVEYAEENYRITKEKYSQQLATSTDLIDAEASLLQAETELTNSIVEYNLLKVRLEKAVGRRIY